MNSIFRIWTYDIHMILFKDRLSMARLLQRCPILCGHHIVTSHVYIQGMDTNYVTFNKTSDPFHHVLSPAFGMNIQRYHSAKAEQKVWCHPSRSLLMQCHKRPARSKLTVTASRTALMEGSAVIPLNAMLVSFHVARGGYMVWNRRRGP